MLLYADGVTKASRHGLGPEFRHHFHGEQFHSFWNQQHWGKDNRDLNLVRILERTLQIGQQQVTQARLMQHPADVLIQPPVAELGLLDFHQAKPVIELGRDIGAEMIDRVLELSPEIQ